MEAGLMKIVWSVNRGWTHDSYFRLRRPIHQGEVSGRMSRFQYEYMYTLHTVHTRHTVCTFCSYDIFVWPQYLCTEVLVFLHCFLCQCLSCLRVLVRRRRRPVRNKRWKRSFPLPRI